MSFDKTIKLSSTGPTVTLLDVRKEIDRCFQQLERVPIHKKARKLRTKIQRLSHVVTEVWNRSRPHGPTQRMKANREHRQLRAKKLLASQKQTAEFRKSKPIFET